MKKKIYLDTSVINKIANDNARQELIAKLTKDFEPLISTLVVNEIVCTKDDSRRVELFEIASELTAATLLKGRRSLMTEPEILIHSLNAVVDESIKLDYFTRFRNYLELPFLSNPQSANDDRYLNLMWKQMEKTEKSHTGYFREKRPESLEKLKELATPEELKDFSSRVGFIRFFLKNQSLLNDLILDKLEHFKWAKITKLLKGKESLILERSEFWRFHLLAKGIEAYNRLFQSENFSHKKNPGWVDTRQSIYLGLVDIFVTADKNQRKFIRLLSKFSITQKSVWSFLQLRKELLQ